MGGVSGGTLVQKASAVLRKDGLEKGVVDATLVIP